MPSGRRRRPILVIASLALVASGCSSTTPADDAGTTSPEPTAAVTPSSNPDNGASDGTTESGEDSDPNTEAPPAPISGSFVPVVIDRHPHDPDAYTQGLEVFDGRLVESTGRYGQSDRRIVDIESGAVIESEPLPDTMFGEGLTVVDGEILQLTWREETYFRSDVDDLDLVDTGRYDGEGWGLCHDGSVLVMSNGTSTLTRRDTDSFEAVSTVTVTRSDGTPVEMLNELECIAGQVWANVYRSDEIVVIDPDSGRVEATIDASSLRPTELPVDDADYALNGIAFDPSNGNVYLTGKYWPVLYEVALAPG